MSLILRVRRLPHGEDLPPGRGREDLRLHHRTPSATRRSSGSTKLAKAAEDGVKANLLAKLEFFNPIASVKDRIGVAMIEAWKRTARSSRARPPWSSRPPATPASRLAFVAAAKGYRLILVMPETMSIERRKMLKLLGAELELTEGPKGMKGAIARPRNCCRKSRRGDAAAVREPGQPGNSPQDHGGGNLERHRRRRRRLRFRHRHRRHDHRRRPGAQARKPDLHVVAVEPADSPILSGGQPGPHKIQGIGAGFVPGVLDTSGL
jgi:cysteine synthase A